MPFGERDMGMDGTRFTHQEGCDCDTAADCEDGGHGLTGLMLSGGRWESGSESCDVGMLNFFLEASWMPAARSVSGLGRPGIVFCSSARVGKVSSDRDPLLPPGRESTKPVTVDPWPS